MRVSAPNFEQLERLNGTRDADLIARRYVDPTLNRGRGAQTNKGSRFDRQSREEFDDGWGQVEDLKPFETIEHVERAKSIITRNESPDIGFDRSINAYRGCEHVMFSRIERRPPEADGVAPHKESDSMQSYNMCLDDSF
jgi:hypothetical protein